MTTSPRRFEFWPDYGNVLLHDESGTAVPIDALPVPPAVAIRSAKWVGAYNESKLPWEDGDRDCLAEGRSLFEIVRDVLAEHGIEVFDWDGMWDVRADAYERDFRARWPTLFGDTPGG